MAQDSVRLRILVSKIRRANNEQDALHIAMDWIDSLTDRAPLYEYMQRLMDEAEEANNSVPVERLGFKDAYRVVVEGA